MKVVLKNCGFWVMGIAIAALCCLLASAGYKNVVPAEVYDSILRIPVFPAEQAVYNRSEGRGKTVLAAHGLVASRQLDESPDKRIIWGDSFVQQLQVDNKYKLPLVLERMLQAEGVENIPEILSFGQGGLTLADYYYLIPRMEQAVPEISEHYLMFYTLYDLMPDMPSGAFVWHQFLSKPQLRFEEIGVTDREKRGSGRPILSGLPAARPLINLGKPLEGLGRFFGLSAWLDEISRYAMINRLDDRPDPYQEIMADPDKVREILQFGLSEIQQQTQLPIYIIYVPQTPTVQAGALLTENPEVEQVRILCEVAKSLNIVVIDTTPYLLQHYRTTGMLPRGFANSRPGQGHLNAGGIHAVAEAIAPAMKAGMK